MMNNEIFKEFNFSNLKEIIEEKFIIEELIGKFEIVNFPETALNDNKSFNNAKFGAAYYCLHKYTRKLQVVIKYNSKDCLYVHLPKGKGGLLKFKIIELWKAKRKDKAENSNNEMELIPVPIFE